MQNEYVIEYCDSLNKKVCCVHSLDNKPVILDDHETHAYVKNYPSQEHIECSLSQMLALKTLQQLAHNDSMQIITKFSRSERITNKQSFYRFNKDYIGRTVSRKEVYCAGSFLPSYHINENSFSVHDFVDCYVLKKEPYYILNGTFLDNFYRLQTKHEKLKLVELEPVNYTTIAQSNYVYLSAMVEKLCHDSNIEPPEWIYKPLYYMVKPYHMFKQHNSSFIISMSQSPIEYRSRNITASKNCLSRL